jgi:PHD/YefM family antitoxin component YafN of YafNO toxin-antitoxin module
METIYLPLEKEEARHLLGILDYVAANTFGPTKDIALLLGTRIQNQLDS